MANSPNYYDILGVPRNADDEAIKRAYRKIVRDIHPDTNKDPDATARFKELTDMRNTLLNPAERRKYDAILKIEKEAPKIDETRRSSVRKPYTLRKTENGFASQKFSYPKEGVRMPVRAIQLIGAYMLARTHAVDRVIRIPLFDETGHPTKQDWARVYRLGNDIFAQIAVDNFFHGREGNDVFLHGIKTQYMGARREKKLLVDKESFLHTALFPGFAGLGGWFSTPQRVQPVLSDLEEYDWNIVSAGHIDKRPRNIIPLPEHLIHELGVFLWAQERIADMLTNKKGETRAPTDPWKIIDTFTWQHLARGQNPDKALYRVDWDLPKKQEQAYTHTEPSWRISNLADLRESICVFNEYVHSNRLTKPLSFEGVLAYTPKHPSQIEHGSNPGMRK